MLALAAEIMASEVLTAMVAAAKEVLLLLVPKASFRGLSASKVDPIVPLGWGPSSES